ncbi:MAG: hypothetical protein WCH85_09520 [Methanomicrobiales archaeon]
MTELQKYQPESFIKFEWRSDKINCSAKVYFQPGELTIFFEDYDSSFQQTIRLKTMKCALGGQRRWLICPKCGCQRMALYLGHEMTFACRSCNGLRYRSHKKIPVERLLYNAEKIRNKSCQPPIFNPVIRPKGMHQTTYQNLRNRIINYETKSHNFFMAWAYTTIGGSGSERALSGKVAQQ